MCDYSLHSVKSRPAKVGDKLTTCNFGTGTRGFAASEDASVAVCVRPGTELSFTDAITCLPTGLIPWRGKVVDYKTAIFRQINKEKIAAHDDGSAFISIPRSLTTSSTNSAVALTATPASSRKPMSLRTKSVITCRTNSVSCRA